MEEHFISVKPQFFEKSKGRGFLMSESNSEQKEKPLAGISLKMASGSKKALFLLYRKGTVYFPTSPRGVEVSQTLFYSLSL